jgi:hypothetical protein
LNTPFYTASVKYFNTTSSEGWADSKEKPRLKEDRHRVEKKFVEAG